MVLAFRRVKKNGLVLPLGFYAKVLTGTRGVVREVLTSSLSWSTPGNASGQGLSPGRLVEGVVPP